jgi:hypothetical protein
MTRINREKFSVAGVIIGWFVFDGVVRSQKKRTGLSSLGFCCALKPLVLRHYF